MRGLRKYWGWLLFAAMITTAWTWALGPGVLIAGWVLVTAYFLFQAPLKLTFVPRRWRELNKGLWVNPTKCLATAGAVVGIVSGVVSTSIQLIG